MTAIMSTPTVAIVGAGISGIATADVLQRCGFRVRLFERAERVGGVWARAYPGIRLQNTAAQYHLSSFPWPFEPDEHPTGEQILRYLDAAVVAKRLDVRLDTQVVSVVRDGAGWQVTTRHAGHESVDRFDHVVLSIGQYTEGKHRPELPGEATFGGRVVTEREVKDLSIFEGQRVAVVGFGKSALDMACLAVGRARSVTHVFRTARWTLPRTVFGLHFTHLLFNRFGSVMMPSWAHPTAAERALHRVAPIVRGFWSGLERLVETLAARQGAGHGPAGAARMATVKPAHGLVPDLRSAAALAPDSYYGHVGSGAIEPVRAEVEGFTTTGLVTSAGLIEADLVVLSVGSCSPSFPFLAPELRQVLEAEADGVQLYRHLVHPAVPGLGFAGYNHGFMHVPAAEVGALWLAALWRGELELPPTAEMVKAIDHVTAWKRQHIHFEPSRSCAINTRFQQYLDILLQDLGVSPYRKPNPVAEVLVRYGAADYAGVVDEYLTGPRTTRRPQPVMT